jgi:GT2 family glycosyltransferase
VSGQARAPRVEGALFLSEGRLGELPLSPAIVAIGPADGGYQVDANLGFGRACNIGFSLTQAPYVLFINPDCIAQPGSVERLVEVLQQHPDMGMVGPMILNPDGSEQVGARRTTPTPGRAFIKAFGLSGVPAAWPGLFKDFNLQNEPVPAQPTDVDAISGACMLVRRTAINQVGLFDEGYFMHCEDLDWCMRFRQKGWKILFVPDARINHALGACSQSRRVFVEWHKHKGMLRFYRKFFRHQYPGVLMGLVTAGVWLRFGLAAVYLTSRDVFAKSGAGRG